MEIDTALKEKVNNWLDKHWKDENKKCPICSSNDWDLRDKIFEIRDLPQENKIFGGSLYPVIILKCKKCAYSLLFNAIDIGIIGGSKE